MEGLRVSVIIPTWNTRELVGRCVDSVLAQELAGGFETIVVDNASTDGTAELLRGYDGRVRAIANDTNVGFGAANNQAAVVARGRVLVFLNSDTELLSTDTLERLAAAVEAPGVGIAGPRLVNPDGSLQPSCAAHPGVLRALVLAAGLARVLPDRLRARLTPHTWSHDRPREVDWVKGAALAVRTDAFHAVGGFWRTTYGEEQDLAYKIAERGLRIRFEPAARVMHVGNQSNMRRYSDTLRGARVANSELLILRDHCAGPRGAAIRAITGAGFALRVPVHRLLGHTAKARLFGAMARQYWAGPEDRIE